MKQTAITKAKNVLLKPNRDLFDKCVIHQKIALDEAIIIFNI